MSGNDEGQSLTSKLGTCARGMRFGQGASAHAGLYVAACGRPAPSNLHSRETHLRPPHRVQPHPAGRRFRVAMRGMRSSGAWRDRAALRQKPHSRSKRLR